MLNMLDKASEVNTMPQTNELDYSVSLYFTNRLGDAIGDYDKLINIVKVVNKPFSFDDYRKLSLYTVCGEACRQIIDATFQFITVSDHTDSVLQPLIQATIAAMDIIYFG